MRRISITLILLYGIAASTWAFSDYDARNIVTQFYNNVKVIADEHYPNGQQTEKFVVAKNNALNLCYKIDISFPNEFYDFGFDNNDSFLAATAYFKRLWLFSAEKRPKINAEILKVQALEEIKSNKKEDSKNFYEVHVKKTITVGYTKKEYTDIVRIITKNGKITEIANESGGGAGESIISLRGKAAELFANKKYDEAFDMYLKIVKKDPSQGDAFYRLGLMAYHKLGCKYRYSNGKERRRAAYDYIEKASKSDDYEIRGYAEHFLYYMIYGV